jgi:RNA polymerase sigma factor (sigma-70 family)
LYPVGPHPGFREFFDDERARLGRALFLVTGDIGEADDLAQEAFVRVFERWDKVATMKSPTGYLYRAALNLHRGRLRRRATSARHDAATVGADGLARIEDRDEILHLLAQLTRNQREALVLTEWMGLTSQEVGDVMRISPSTVRVHLSRAKATLREAKVNIDE